MYIFTEIYSLYGIQKLFYKLKPYWLYEITYSTVGFFSSEKALGNAYFGKIQAFPVKTSWIQSMALVIQSGPFSREFCQYLGP